MENESNSSSEQHQSLELSPDDEPLQLLALNPMDEMEEMKESPEIEDIIKATFMSPDK